MAGANNGPMTAAAWVSVVTSWKVLPLKLSLTMAAATVRANPPPRPDSPRMTVRNQTPWEKPAARSGTPASISPMIIMGLRPYLSLMVPPMRVPMAHANRSLFRLILRRASDAPNSSLSTGSAGRYMSSVIHWTVIMMIRVVT